MHNNYTKTQNIQWKLDKLKLKRKLSDKVKYVHSLLKYFRRPITITVERLSDHSRITFTISSDKTIKQLRALLNHHLPPLSPSKFDLYSYQRGALIHFHPSSFKLDYFPVIFDQSILLLKMDDRPMNDQLERDNPTRTRNQGQKILKNEQCHLLNEYLPSKNKFNSSKEQRSSSPVTCLSLLKQLFHFSSSTNVNTDGESNLLTY